MPDCLPAHKRTQMNGRKDGRTNKRANYASSWCSAAALAHITRGKAGRMRCDPRLDTNLQVPTILACALTLSIFSVPPSPSSAWQSWRWIPFASGECDDERAARLECQEVRATRLKRYLQKGYTARSRYFLPPVERRAPVPQCVCACRMLAATTPILVCLFGV